mgnify:FL=1
MHYKILPALPATILLVASLCASARAQRLPCFRPDIFRITPVIGMGEGLFMKKNATTYGVGMFYEHVHFNCTHFFNIGLELAMGTSLINKYKPSNKPEVPQGSAPFYKLGFQLGFRF